jgi:hypothetical protein
MDGGDQQFLIVKITVYEMLHRASESAVVNAVMNVQFCVRRGTFWLPERLFAPQRGLCCTKRRGRVVLRIRQVPGSNLCSETGYPDEVVVIFLRSSRRMLE